MLHTTQLNSEQAPNSPVLKDLRKPPSDPTVPQPFESMNFDDQKNIQIQNIDTTSTKSYNNNYDEIIAIFTIVIAIAAILQVISTLLISYYVNKFGKDAEKVANVRNTNAQWQNFNLLALNNREFCDVLSDMEYDSEDINTIRKRYVMFYILNILYDDYYTRRDGRIIEGFSSKMAKDHIRLLIRSENELMQILKGGRGYSDEFVDYIEKLSKRYVTNLPDRNRGPDFIW